MSKGSCEAVESTEGATLRMARLNRISQKSTCKVQNNTLLIPPKVIK